MYCIFRDNSFVTPIVANNMCLEIVDVEMRDVIKVISGIMAQIHKILL